jgi:putative glutamine amidotransferase
MPYPLIGLTTYRNLSEQGYPGFSVSEAYTESLVKAGACPVLIPTSLTGDITPDLLNKLDGVLFTGGGDIDPDLYGQAPHPLAGEIDADRDRQEIQLISQVIEKGLPFFGICRGLQIINVALGGDLYVDILDQHPNAIKHDYYPDYPREYLAHDIQIDHSSFLGAVFSENRMAVNSLHHQGVRNLAPNLKGAAFSPDGIVEALEMLDYPSGIAVQWHPENLQEYEPMQTLFRYFVASAVDNRSK